MEGTQGVSGVHCSVSYDSETNVFTLTDLGSTYGTYLIGGQQVLAKTSLMLKPGDSFYVGDKANVCRVEVVQ
ncbi:MAG: FHA domain-containing protein [Eubacterium sp.]|nr:FHA domain-containing protein [Eubacterium sp.]